MVSNLVIAYPKLSEEDYNWIQTIREEYDSRYYKVVDPHFTIVFPVFNYDVTQLENHIENVCNTTNSIQFTIRVTTIVKDSFSDFTDLFLVPDEGNSQIIKLHDKLYIDILSEELRLDIPFIPHIGIGASKSPNKAKKISDNINKENILINGEINELELIEYDYPVINSKKKFMLL